MQTSLTEHNDSIAHEMLTHPALFIHSQAKKVAIMDSKTHGILHEVLKHPHITEVWQIEKQATTNSKINDPRVHLQMGDSAEWVAKVAAESFDVLITVNPANTPIFFKHCLQALNNNGLLIQQGESIFNLPMLKTIYQKVRAAGFNDVQILNFPQPDYPSGWRSALIAIKQGILRRASEKNIFNKPFTTHYYNFDAHGASFALPEFIREEINL